MKALNFETVYTENNKWVKNVLTQKLFGDRATAEDLTQDTFVKLWKYINDFDPSKSNIKTYITNIMNSIFIDYCRRNQLKHRRFSNNIESFVNSDNEEQEYPIDSKSETDSNIIESELIKVINDTLENIRSKKQRVVCKLMLRGWSLVDISKKFNINEESVKVYVHRFRKEIKEKAYAIA